jgi:AcrR family transcriptional regulator
MAADEISRPKRTHVQKAGRSSATSGTRGQKKRSGEGRDARSALIRAALDSIIEVGYYRASSNEIARRAGVSWGALQYYFGSREELFIAVLQDHASAFIKSLVDFEAPQDSLRSNLRSVAELVWQQHASPDHAAILQIDLDLSRDPRLAESTARMVEHIRDSFRSGWDAVVTRAFKDAVGGSEMGRLVFEVLHGLALAELFNRELSRGFAAPPDESEFARYREIVLAMLEGLLTRGVATEP